MPSKSSEEKSENNFEYFRGWEWSRTTGTPYFHTIALPQTLTVTELPQPFCFTKIKYLFQTFNF